MNLIPCFECFVSLFKILKLFVKFLNYHGGVCSRDTWATDAKDDPIFLHCIPMGAQNMILHPSFKFKGSWMKAFVICILTLPIMPYNFQKHLGEWLSRMGAFVVCILAMFWS
jgi:hypothetical protein